MPIPVAWIWISAYIATPLRDEAGKIIGAFEVVSDQTAIKQAARVAEKIANYQDVETQKLVECLTKLAEGDIYPCHRNRARRYRYRRR